MPKRRSIPIGLAALAALLFVAPALAQPVDEITVSGPTDYDALPASIIIESIVTNEVTLTFPPAGGPFTGNAVLELFHDVPTQGCSFASGHFHELSGTFDPDSLVFAGTFLETVEETGLVAGECDNFSFVRTFDNDAGEFFARLDPVAGTISTTTSVEPLFFTLPVDPALVADLVPDTQPPPPPPPDGATTPGDTQTDPTTTPEDPPPDPQTDPVDATTDPADQAEPPIAPPPLATTLAPATSPPPGLAADTDGGGGGPGLPLILLLAVVALFVFFFLLFKRFSTSTPSGPLPASGGATGPGSGMASSGDDATPFHDPRGGDITTPVSADDLDAIPTAPPDLGLSDDADGAPVPVGGPVPGAGPGGGPDPAGGGPGADPDDQDIDCGPLEKAYRDAKDACDEAAREADRLGKEFDKADDRIEEAEADLAELPSEETRVELPDGTSLSQLDLDLRRQAAGAAWDAYMADPTPETARAAEEAWNEQATPEWLDEQRAAHQAEKDRIQERLDSASADKEQVGKDLADARDRQKDACDKAAEAKRKLDECEKARDEAERAAEEARRAEEEAREAEVREAEEERRRREEEAAAAPPPTAGAGDPSRPEGCKDGDTKTRMVGNSETFLVSGGEKGDLRNVSIRLTLVGTDSAATTEAKVRGRMRDGRLTFTSDTKKTKAPAFHEIIEFTEESLNGPLEELLDTWDGVGSTRQQLRIEMEAEVSEVTARCVQEYVCIDGQWQPQGPRENRIHWSPKTVAIPEQRVTRTGDPVAVLTRILLDFKARLEPYADGRDQLQQFKSDCISGNL